MSNQISAIQLLLCVPGYRYASRACREPLVRCSFEDEVFNVQTFGICLRCHPVIEPLMRECF